VTGIVRPLKGHFYILTFPLDCFHWLTLGSVFLPPAIDLPHTMLNTGLFDVMHNSARRPFDMMAGNIVITAIHICFEWRVMCFSLRSIRFLLTILKEGAGRGLLWLADMCHT
jgi:hypothetical protein